MSFPHEKSCRLSCKFHVCCTSFKLKCYVTKHLIFLFQVQHFRISDIFYKMQNIKKLQKKAVVPFLQINLKWANILWLTDTFVYLFEFPGEYYKGTNLLDRSIAFCRIKRIYNVKFSNKVKYRRYSPIFVWLTDSAKCL